MNGVLERAGRRLVGLVRRGATSYVVVLVLAVVVGLQVAPFAWSTGVESGTDGTVAVVPLSGGINGQTAAGVSAQLQRAREDPRIDAVVLLVNSPGGGAPASETLYFQVKQTAEQMPVIGSVNAQALSGGYYALAPTDTVYAKPSSLVGSVGTLTTLPLALEPIDFIITSGPDKLRSGDTRDWYYKLEAVSAAFQSAVMENRDIQISREEVSRAQIYPGGTAVENGMADEIGGLEAATRQAASDAELDSYNVRFLAPGSDAAFLSRSAYTASRLEEKRLVSPTRFVGPPNSPPSVPTVLMLPGTVLRAAYERTPDATVNATVRNGTEVANVTVEG